MQEGHEFRETRGQNVRDWTVSSSSSYIEVLTPGTVQSGQFGDGVFKKCDEVENEAGMMGPNPMQMVPREKALTYKQQKLGA